MEIDYLKIFETIPDDFRLQSYILSHFYKLDDEYRNLLKANYDIAEKDINNRLIMTGSKFYESFAINPISLYEKILSGYKYNNKTIIERETKTDITITYPFEIYNSGIGTEGIINIKELNETEKLKIQKLIRKGININTIQKNQKPVWELNIIIGKNKDDKYFIKTIFPGILAPPFPDKESQGDKEYNISSEFWENHIFII